jgi:hypothetical protein
MAVWSAGRSFHLQATPNCSRFCLNAYTQSLDGLREGPVLDGMVIGIAEALQPANGTATAGRRRRALPRVVGEFGPYEVPVRNQPALALSSTDCIQIIHKLT